MQQPFGMNYYAALASIELCKDAGILDLTSDDYDFLTSAGVYQDKLWLPIDRSRARRCVESAVYGALDMLGFPRFPAPVEFIAAAISVYVAPQNVMTACSNMDGCEYVDNVINGIEQPVRAHQLFSHILRIKAGQLDHVNTRERTLTTNQLTAPTAKGSRDE